MPESLPRFHPSQKKFLKKGLNTGIDPGTTPLTNIMPSILGVGEAIDHNPVSSESRLSGESPFLLVSGFSLHEVLNLKPEKSPDEVPVEALSKKVKRKIACTSKGKYGGSLLEAFFEI